MLLYLETGSPNENVKKQSNVFGDLKEGLNYFLSVHELRTVTTSISLSLVGAGARFVLGKTN